MTRIHSDGLKNPAYHTAILLLLTPSHTSLGLPAIGRYSLEEGACYVRCYA